MAWIVTLCFAASLVLWIVLRSRIQDLEWQLAKATESRHSTDLQLSALTARVSQLEKDLAARSSPALQAAAVIEEPLPAEPPPMAAQQPAREETTTTIPIPEPITEPSLFEPSLTEPLPIPPVTGGTVIDRGVSRNEEWEALVGGSILNKVGALILVVGLALFLAYSFTYMGPAGRAAVSALLSAALLAGGIQVERRRKYQTFAYGLIGAGWAGLYATAYATYALPAARIISDPFWGSLILLATGAAMVLHSIRYRVQTVTSIAFFTPFAALAVTPNTPFALISLVPLAAALLYLAWRFEWYRMVLFGLAATWGTCVSRGSANASLASSQSLLLAYWLLFEAFDLLRIRRKVTGPGLTLLMPLNAIAFIGLSFISWDAHASTDLWFGSALAAMLFLASTFVRLDMGGRYEPSLALAATFGGLAILGRAEGLWASACIAAEAELLFLAGRRFRLPFVRYLGIMAFVVSVSNIGFSPSSRRSFTLLPGVTMNNASPALLLHTFLFYLNRKLWKAGWYFSSAAAVLVCIVLLVETASGYEGLALAAFAVVLFEIARRTALPEFRIQFYFVALTALTTLLISHFSDLHHSAPASAWLSTLGIALASWWVTAQAWRGGGWLKTNERTLVRDISGTIGSALALATFWMVLPDSLVALASLALGIAAVELGLSLQAPSSPLLGCTIACIASIELYATDFSQGKAIWLGNGIPFLAGLYYLWYRLRALAGIIREPVRIILSLMALLLLTVIFYVEFPGRYRTVAWGMEGVALLAAGLGVRERILRLEGLFLLLACILKLFLYDLRNLETIYRILSFIALGVILLGVSWIYTRFRERLRHYL